MSPVTPHTVESITHTVVLRYFPSLVAVRGTASFCHLYTLHVDPSPENETGSKWERAPIQGSLFVCETLAGPGQEYPAEIDPLTGLPSSAPLSASSAPRQYYLLVLNRLAVTTFTYRLRSPEQIEIGESGLHIMIQFPQRDDGVEGYGIYIHESNEEEMELRRGVCQVVEQLAKEAVTQDQIAAREELARGLGQAGGAQTGATAGMGQVLEGGVNLMGLLQGSGGGVSVQHHQQQQQQPQQPQQPHGAGVLDALFKNARQKWEQQQQQPQQPQHAQQPTLWYGQ